MIVLNIEALNSFPLPGPSLVPSQPLGKNYIAKSQWDVLDHLLLFSREPKSNGKFSLEWQVLRLTRTLSAIVSNLRKRSWKSVSPTVTVPATLDLRPSTSQSFLNTQKQCGNLLLVKLRERMMVCLLNKSLCLHFGFFFVKFHLVNVVVLAQHRRKILKCLS